MKQLAYCDDPSNFVFRDGSFESIEILEDTFNETYVLRRKGKLGCLESRTIDEVEKDRILIYLGV